MYGENLKTRSITNKINTDPKQFFNLITVDAYEVSDVQPVNENCIFATYKNSNAFLRPSKNTNVIIAAFVTTYARLELHSYLERLGNRALYCDTDYVIYKHYPGQCEPEMSEFIGGMTDELKGITLMNIFQIYSKKLCL